MKKIIKSLLLILIFVLCMTLQSCKKTIVYNEDKASDFVNEYYQYYAGNKSDFVAIDLRDLTEYGNGHLSGFISYQYYKSQNESETEQEYQLRMGTQFITWIKGMYGNQNTVFLIDNDGTLVTMVGSKLKANGYSSLRIYKNGYQSITEYIKDIIPVKIGVDDCGC